MAYEQKHIEGDAVVGHDAVVGGDLKVNGQSRFKGNVRIDGWLDCPNIAGPHKGFFATEGELKAAHPSPQEGWVAVVGDNPPAGKVYRVNKGLWINTNNDSTGSLDGDVNAYSKQVGELASGLQELSAKLSHATVTQVAPLYDNNGNLVIETEKSDGTYEEIPIPKATTEKDGIMSAADKARLDESVAMATPLTGNDGSCILEIERNNGTYIEFPFPKAGEGNDGMMSKEDKQSLEHLPHAIEQEKERALLAEKSLGEQISEESNRATNHEAEIHSELGSLERRHTKDVEELTKKIEKAHCRIDQFSKPNGCKGIMPAASVIYDSYNSGLEAKTVQEAIDMLVDGGAGGGGSADLTELREDVADSVSSVGVNFGFADEVRIWSEKNNGEVSSESIPAASQYAAGVMSKEDKKSLDGIVSGSITIGNAEHAEYANKDSHGRVISDTYITKNEAGNIHSYNEVRHTVNGKEYKTATTDSESNNFTIFAPTESAEPNMVLIGGGHDKTPSWAYSSDLEVGKAERADKDGNGEYFQNKYLTKEEYNADGNNASQAIDVANQANQAVARHEVIINNLQDTLEDILNSGGSGSTPTTNASQIVYNNSNTDLESVRVQDVITELNTKVLTETRRATESEHTISERLETRANELQAEINEQNDKVNSLNSAVTGLSIGEEEVSTEAVSLNVTTVENPGGGWVTIPGASETNAGVMTAQQVEQLKFLNNNAITNIGVSYGFPERVDLWMESPADKEPETTSIPSASQSAAGVMSSSDKKKLDAIFKSGLIVINGVGPSLNISDTNGNLIARFSGGHIKTKYFDSRNYSTDKTPDVEPFDGSTIVVNGADFADVSIGSAPVAPEELNKFAYSFPFTIGG